MSGCKFLCFHEAPARLPVWLRAHEVPAEILPALLMLCARYIMVYEAMKVATTSVTIRMDTELRAAMEKLCVELEMDLTTALMIFIEKAMGEQTTPFQIFRPDPFYSESNMQALRETIKQVDGGKVIYKTLTDLGAME